MASINGFYDMKSFKLKKDKDNFIKDAINYSYQVNIQNKYKKGSSSREIDINSSIAEYLKTKFPKGSTLNCIDRNIYYKGSIKGANGEIAYSNNWYFIYCNLSLENLDKIVKKYKLKLKIWG